MQLEELQAEFELTAHMLFSDEAQQALLDFQGETGLVSLSQFSGRIAALDQSLSELNLLDLDSNDKSTSEMIWKTVGDFQKDPYTVGLSMFSKITDKILFSPVEREMRPEEEMAELLQV